MREEIKTCQDSELCSIELKALDPSIISIVHIPGKHIIHTSDDYDNKGGLKLKTCEDLAELGVFHVREDMSQEKIKALKEKSDFIKKGLKF